MSDMTVVGDLWSQQLVLAVDVDAPTDRGAVARVSWLAKQLVDGPDDLVVEAFAKRAKQCTSASLAAVREDRQAVLPGDGKEPHRFRLVLRLSMGQGRRTGKRNPGFIDSVLIAIDRFYGEVVQQLTEWRPPAPKLQRPAALPPRPPEDDTPEPHAGSSHASRAALGGQAPVQGGEGVNPAQS